eukprot:TRINITY_DN4829_c0_g2_i5.p1 TRINITY_DN4829_c0_g2~~TRINITY_DN4829_c0_g2_i5.p1  ORF type:complete len:429 (-),score=72.31 TRINITY_DN4829_c0_g2_i5:137-1423(-)
MCIRDRKNTNDKLRRELNTCKQRIDELEALLRRKGVNDSSMDDSQRCKNLEKSLQDLKQQNQALAIEVASYKTRSENLKKEMEQLMQGQGSGAFRLDYELLKDNIQELETKMSQLSRRNQLLELELSNQRLKCAALEAGGKGLDQSAQKALEERFTLQKEVKELQYELEECKKAVEAEKRKNEQFDEERKNILGLIKQRDTAVKEQENIQKKCESIARENDKLKSDLIKMKTKSMQVEFEEMKKRNNDLEKEVAKLSAMLQNSQLGDQSNAINQGDSVIYEGFGSSAKQENELLIQQKNQLQRKMESLQKELENKMREMEKLKVEKQTLFENLTKTNQKLMQENASLSAQMKAIQDEKMVRDNADLDSSQSFHTSMYMGHRMNLRDKINALEAELEAKQKELEASNLEKDRLLVEISRMFASRRSAQG